MNKDILRRYFEGKSSRWEMKQVKEYFHGDDMHAFDEYLKSNDSAGDAPVENAVKEKFLDGLMDRIHQQEEAIPLPKQRQLPAYLKIAASLLILSGISIWFFKANVPMKNLERTISNKNITNVTRSLQYAVLTDGTKIWINPGTTISYDDNRFNDSTRDIDIKGEAFFDVAHDPKKPFRVHAGKLITTVLGTAFNVEAYSGERKVRVSLIRGHVRISDGIGKQELVPGQVIDYDTQSFAMKVNHIDVNGKMDLYTGGKIVFQNVPLANVITRLEKMMDLTLAVSKPELLYDKTVSGNYYRANPEEALHSILFMHGLHFKKKGDRQYLIY